MCRVQLEACTSTAVQLVFSNCTRAPDPESPRNETLGTGDGHSGPGQ
eukprot:SAG22_NODE_21700_length_254_cov_2.225806_1_plen_46_part_10